MFLGYCEITLSSTRYLIPVFSFAGSLALSDYTDDSLSTVLVDIDGVDDVTLNITGSDLFKTGLPIPTVDDITLPYYDFNKYYSFSTSGQHRLAIIPYKSTFTGEIVKKVEAFTVNGDTVYPTGAGPQLDDYIIIIRADRYDSKYVFAGYRVGSNSGMPITFSSQFSLGACPTYIELTQNIPDIVSLLANPSHFFSLQSSVQREIELEFNIISNRSDGSKFYPDPNELSLSSSNQEITSIKLTPIYGEYYRYLLSYNRPEVLLGDWTITISSIRSPLISATLNFKFIPTVIDIYTPGSGQGIPSQPGGGNGNFGTDPSTGQPEVSDNIANDLPGSGTNLPSTEPEVANAGLFTHYVCNNIKVAEFADWLWADNLGKAIMRDFASVFYGSPIESVISLMSYPFNVGAYAQTQTQSIRLGYNDTGVIASALTSTGIRIDWGTIQLTEFWGNFLDYAPHTKIELYLPWCTGFVPIDPHEVLPGSIQVITTIELAKGTCVHSIINHNGSVIGIHSGICGKQIPVTATDFSGKYVSMVTAAVSGVVAGTLAIGGTIAGAAAGGAAASRVAGAGGSAAAQFSARNAAETVTSEPYMRGAGRAANSALNNSRAAFRTPPSVQRNGSFSDAGAGMGIQYPYLIISRPEQSVPSQYGHHYGYPSNIYASLSQLKGYTEIGEIHLDGITATDAEVDELDAILKGGVIF